MLADTRVIVIVDRLSSALRPGPRPSQPSIIGNMSRESDINLLNWSLDPSEVVDRWPIDRPLLMLPSAGRHRRWARFSIFACPEGWFNFDGRSDLTGGGRRARLAAGFKDRPLEDLDTLLAATGGGQAKRPGVDIPFLGGWIGLFSYDLGRVIEPAAGQETAAGDDRRWPLIALARCDSALVHDNLTGAWLAVGEEDWPAMLAATRPNEPRQPAADPTVGRFASSLQPDAYLDAVARTLAYIAAGDIFQANITQRLTATFAGSTRLLAARALASSAARYGAYLELPDGRCIISMSPELFLQLDGRRREVVTRPVKGTRPGRAARRELIDSEKDAAELHMIIDLMRNDLGRVCEYGSVRVPAARTIETHRTVHHGVGEVRGVLRSKVSFGDLLRAAFPGGSVTGAPKIRAMQIIDEIEPVRRGPYCGSIGYISDCGSACLNIAIRTMALTGEREDGRFDLMRGLLDYGAGGGIVADSQPIAEYRESLDKAEVLRLALGAPSLIGAPSEPAVR
jgi:para-aminobenzoate synthetase component 1